MLAFHRFNFLLEPARGGRRTQSAVGINENGNSSGRRGTINLTDKAAIAHIRARGTNSNNIVAVVMLPPAVSPNATFRLPVVLKESAAEPIAMLWLPVVLSSSADSPLAVLKRPAVLR